VLSWSPGISGSIRRRNARREVYGVFRKLTIDSNLKCTNRDPAVGASEPLREPAAPTTISASSESLRPAMSNGSWETYSHRPPSPFPLTRDAASPPSRKTLTRPLHELVVTTSTCELSREISGMIRTSMVPFGDASGAGDSISATSRAFRPSKCRSDIAATIDSCVVFVVGAEASCNQLTIESYGREGFKFKCTPIRQGWRLFPRKEKKRKRVGDR